MSWREILASLTTNPSECAPIWSFSMAIRPGCEEFRGGLGSNS
jgi:hypothetical protein